MRTTNHAHPNRSHPKRSHLDRPHTNRSHPIARPTPMPSRSNEPGSGAPRVRCRSASLGRRGAASLLWTAGCAATGLLVPGVAEASTLLAEAQSLEQVINNLRNVLVGLLVGLATLFATVGGVRYILSGGDPGEAEAAKKTLRFAAIGYAVAVLAPMLVKLLQKIVEA